MALFKTSKPIYWWWHGNTVTGTANAIMAAVLTSGTTILDGACEPEIVDLCEMLKKMGAKISGLDHLIKIDGVDNLNGCKHRVIPDRIEAATYIMVAAITRGQITINGINPTHFGAFSKVMKDSGILLDEVNANKDALFIHTRPEDLSPFEIITLPYPGFPTDLQAQACALACTIPGLSILTERVYPSRFMHIPELPTYGCRSISRGGQCYSAWRKTHEWCPGDGIRSSSKCCFNPCRISFRRRDLGPSNLPLR